VGYRAQTPGYSEINYANSNWGWSRERPDRSIMAVEADSGKILWQHTAKISPLSLTVGGKSVFFCDGETMVALDRQTASPHGRRRYRCARPS
jgi:outer membrane protein assembly factor BamB